MIDLRGTIHLRAVSKIPDKLEDETVRVRTAGPIEENTSPDSRVVGVKVKLATGGSSGKDTNTLPL